MENRVFNVLFICTGNSARSIMAEGLLNAMGQGRFQAFSAGSHPKGAVNPGALRALAGLGVSTEGYRSKSWEEFSGANAPALDFVFTVCDKAAGEVCPVWPGQPMTAHWGVEDPAEQTGSTEQIDRRFLDVMVILKRRIELFLALPLEKLDKLSLQKELQSIGQQSAQS